LKAHGIKFFFMVASLNKSCSDVPVQKSGLLLIGTQSLCQVSNTRSQDIYLSDILTYFKKARIPAQPLMVI